MRRKFLYLSRCAIKFTQTVGADLYIRPKVPFRTTPTASRHQIMVTINKMNEWIVCADATR